MRTNDKITFFAPLSKKNDDLQIVEGFASTEDLDSQGEVVKLSAIEKALPDYMKFANIREMHQYSAVGKTISANVDRTKKGLYIIGKVIDKIAWEKVKEGVYAGFSIGGRIKKKVGNTIHELSLSEISLVDRPANPSAVFSLVKINEKEALAKEKEKKEEEKTLKELKEVKEQLKEANRNDVVDTKWPDGYFDRHKEIV